MFNTFHATGAFTVMPTASELKLSPKYVYVDGKRTDKQETYKGSPIFRVKGLALIIDGEIVADAYIYTVVPVDKLPQPKLGQVLTGHGMLAIRAAKGYGLTGSLRIDSFDNFQLPNDN